MATAGLASAGSVPATTRPVPGASILTHIACAPKSTTCVAVGTKYSAAGPPSYSVVLPVDNGVPGKLAHFPAFGISGLQPDGVACPTSKDCWIVGEANSGSGFAMTFDNGTLGPVHTISGTAVLYDVSCGTTTTCWATAANGSYKNAALVRLTDSGTKVYPLKGTYGYLFRGGEGGNTDMLCRSATSCTVLGSANLGSGPGLVMTISSGKITATNKVKTVGLFSGLACETTKSCIGVGISTATTPVGVVDDLTNGLPASPKAVAGTSYLASAACPSATQCEAVGFSAHDDAVLVPVKSGKAGHVQSLFSGQLNGIACASDKACWAVGSKASTPETAVVYSFVP
jgi:hypothetical protein